MSYDLHGMWDQHNKFTGLYLKGHSNATEIDDGLDLHWCNSVDLRNVVLGFGFYRRGIYRPATSQSCLLSPGQIIHHVRPGFP